MEPVEAMNGIRLDRFSDPRPGTLKIKRQIPRPRRHQCQTKYIQIDTRSCEACWKCVEVCPQQALGKVDVFFHRHVRIVSQEDCTGCKKCVPVCPQNVIDYIYHPKSRAKEPICSPHNPAAQSVTL